MKSQSINCVILGHRNFGESDKLIFLYSEEFGKLKLIAKGARKINSKFTGHLETLNFAEAEIYFGPRNIILTEINTIQSFRKIREDLEKLKSALQIAEITEKTIYENQEVPNLIPLLKLTLKHLVESKAPNTISYSFIIKFLDLLGMIPDFKSLQSNLPEKYLKFLNFVKEEPYSKIEKIVTSQEEEQKIKEILQKIIEFQTDNPLKSLNI